MNHTFANNLVIHSIYIGIFATLIMDAFNLAGKKLHIHAGGSYIVIGRWFGGFYRGQFKYDNILTADSLPHEKIIGLITHYCIGVVLAFIYLLCVGLMGIQAQTMGWAITYGTLTNVLPWFIMFPACGFGFLALKGPKNNTMIRSSFLNHLGYGIALSIGAQLVALL